MGKKKQLTMDEREIIIKLKREGMSCREIAKKAKIGVNTVSYTLKRNAETGANWDRDRSGRPKATTEKEDKFLLTTSLHNTRITGQQLREQLNVGRSKQVSLSTVMRRLRDTSILPQSEIVKKPSPKKEKTKRKRIGCSTPK